jgi:hypothetical protein
VRTDEKGYTIREMLSRSAALIWSVGTRSLQDGTSSLLIPTLLTSVPWQTYVVKTADGLMFTEELGRRLALHDLGLVLGRHGRCVMSPEEEEEASRWR